MEFNDELRMAWDFVECTGTNLFLTGKAGTGKTTFLKHLKEHSPKRMIVVAPTGIAAINAGGQTIHSFFQLPLSPYVPGASFSGDGNRKYQFSKVKRKIISTLDLLVIDEISMVRADVLDAVDSVLRRYRIHSLPFGGVQLLLIGDLQQLAPVVKDEEWVMLRDYYATPYFFSSQALNQTPYFSIELRKVYRQHDEHFLQLLNNIREYKADAHTLAQLNSRYIPNFQPPSDGDYIRLTTHNAPANRINESELEALPSKAYTFRATIEGDFPEFSYPADERLTLKVGAQVMFVKNDSSGQNRYFNGLIASVEKLDTDYIKVRPRNGDEAFVLDREQWSNSKYTLNAKTKEITEEVEGTFTQYPLRLAWAITIHKSQGLTFEHAIIDVSRSFAHGQAYVALSRCRSLEGMVLSKPLTTKAIIGDATIDSYVEEDERRHPSKQQLAALRKAYAVNILRELFSITELRDAAESLFRVVNDNLYKKYPGLVSDWRNTLSKLNELASVSQKFGAQVSAIVNGQHPMPEGHTAQSYLQLRIRQAAVYFLKQLSPITELMESAQPNFSNEAGQTLFAAKHDDMGALLKLKSELLAYESNEKTAFTPADYLRKKAHIALENEEATTREETTRNTKQKKKRKKMS